MLTEKITLANMPSPPGRNIARGVAGGYGRLHSASRRGDWGHDPGVYMNPPLMEAYAGALAEREGLEAEIVDGQGEDLSLGRFVKRVAATQPDLLFVRISLPSYNDDAILVSALREALPATAIIGWGALCRSMPLRVLGDHPLDAVTPWTVDETVQHLLVEAATGKGLEGIRRSRLLVHAGARDTAGVRPPGVEGSGGLRGPPPGTLDSLPLPAYHLLPMDRYILDGKRFFTCFSSRGCSFRCDYCPYPLGFGSPWRGRDPKRVADEILYLHGSYGTERIHFRDQTWNMDRRRCMKLCELLSGQGAPVEWNVAVRADRLDLRLAVKMREAGCFGVEMGVETGDPSLFSSIGKKSSSLRLVERGFRNARRAGLATAAHLMVGLPGEKPDSARMTRHLLRRLRPDRIHISVATPYPGTRFWDQASREGWIVDHELGHLDSKSVVLSYPGFTRLQITETIRALRDWSHADSHLNQARDHLRERRIASLLKKSARLALGTRRFAPRYADGLRPMALP